MSQAPVQINWPHSDNSEDAVLSAMMRDDEAVGECLSILTPRDFHQNGNQILFRHMERLASRGQPCDGGLLFESLCASGEIDAAGGFLRLDKLMQNWNPRGTHKHHAGVVREKSRLRNLMRAARNVLDEAAKPGATADETVSAAAEFLCASVQDSTDRTVTVGEAAEAALRRAREAMDAAQRGEVIGIRTGLADLDRAIGGLRPCELTIVAANPSIGKSAFVADIVRKAARQGVEFAFFALEMEAATLTTRMISAECNVPSSTIRKGLCTPRQMELVEDATEFVKSFRGVIDDTPGLSAGQIAVKARMAKMRLPNLSLVVIDGLWLMHHHGERGSTDASKIGQTLKGLLKIAKDLNVHVLLVHQLNRENEMRAGATDTKAARPKLSDLRETGSAEQDANVILLLWRERVAGVDVKTIPTTVIVAKNREGPIADIPVMFFPQTQTFHNAEWMDRD